MNKLSIPYTKDNRILDLLGDKELQYVKEIFMPLPYNIFKSGRVYGEYETNAYSQIYKSQIQKAKSMGLQVSMLATKIIIDYNTGLVEISRAMREIESLKRDYDIDKVVISNLTFLSTYGEYLKGLGLKIEMSTISDIDCIEKVDQMMALFPFIDSVCLNNTFIFNHDDIVYLKSKYPNLELKILVNHGCIVNCMAHIVHHNYLAEVIYDVKDMSDMRRWQAYSNQREITRTCKTCERYCANSGQGFNIISEMSYIRPEDVHLYDDVIDLFKLSGREHDAEDIIKYINAYGEEKCDGDFGELMDFPFGIFNIDNQGFPEEFGKQRSNCGHKCHKCTYCQGIKDLVIKLPTGS
jgi:collagenase-like PrtC family protease